MALDWAPLASSREFTYGCSMVGTAGKIKGALITLVCGAHFGCSSSVTTVVEGVTSGGLSSVGGSGSIVSTLPTGGVMTIATASISGGMGTVLLSSASGGVGSLLTNSVTTVALGGTLSGGAGMTTSPLLTGGYATVVTSGLVGGSSSPTSGGSTTVLSATAATSVASTGGTLGSTGLSAVGGTISASGGVASGGVASGGVASGGVASGGADASGGIASSGGTASSAPASGGTATGGTSSEVTGGTTAVGGCNPACSGLHAQWSCVNSSCVVTSCDSGWGDCSNSVAGCELDVTADASNCGRCGNSCSSGVCRRSTCLTTTHYGYTGPGVASTSLSTGYLVGIQVNIPTAGVLTAIGVVLSDGANPTSMNVGLYGNAAGYPTTLLSSSGSSPVTVGTGGVEVPVTPVDLTAGDYWIVGTWNSTASFATNSTSITKTMLLSTMSFGPLPTQAPTAMNTYSRTMPNWYVVVAQ